MANSSLSLSPFGKIKLSRLEKLSAKWDKEILTKKDGDRDRKLARQVNAVRKEYRDKYRPALPPESGVTL